MNFSLIQQLQRSKPQIIRRNQLIFHLSLPARDRQTMASAVEVAVKAAGHAVPLQQVKNLLAPVALIQRRRVEKAVFFPLSPRLQRGLQANQLPI